MSEKFCPRCFEKFGSEPDQCPECKIRLVTALDKDLTGQVLDDRYEVLGTLGKGGMGVVYRAKQKIIDRPVALKVLRRELIQDESAVKRFMVEAKASSSLRSAHTITLYDFGITQEGLLYFTMELLDGTVLTDAIKNEAPFAPERAADIIKQVCESLKEAHGKGILHRDLKPDNIFLLKGDDGKEHVKVLDFGIAKILDDGSSESITKTGMVCGTPLYLSPEQAVGRDLDARSDLYSLGVILYEMLAGEPPFVDATPVGILMKQVNEIPMALSRRNPDITIPDTVEQCLMRVLAKNPDDRPGDATQFAAELDDALAGKGSKDVPMPGMMTTMAGVQLTTAEFYAQKEEGGVTAPLISEAGGDRIDRDGTDASGSGADGVETSESSSVAGAAPRRSPRGLMIGVGSVVTLAAMVGILMVAFPPAPEESKPQAEAAGKMVADAVSEAGPAAASSGTDEVAAAEAKLAEDKAAAEAAREEAEKRASELAAREALLQEKEEQLAKAKELAEREKALLEREKAAQAAEVAAKAAAAAQAEAAAKAKAEEEAAELAAQQAEAEAAAENAKTEQAERLAEAAAAKKRAAEAKRKAERAKEEQRLAELQKKAAEKARKKAEAERKKAAAEKKKDAEKKTDEKKDDEPDFEEI